MNKQSYHEYLFKHLRRNSKRILSIMLAFAILTENPLSVYAGTATSSNIQKPVVDYEETSPLDNIDIGDFDPDTYDGVPFYFDENGNRIQLRFATMLAKKIK